MTVPRMLVACILLAEAAGCARVASGPNMYHEVLVPREFRAGRACAHTPSNHERYVGAYETGWWACIESHVRDIDYQSTETDKIGVGWPAAVAGTRQGFEDCEVRIKHNIGRYGKHEMWQYLRAILDAK